jgi:hypothetical protein
MLSEGSDDKLESKLQPPLSFPGDFLEECIKQTIDVSKYADLSLLDEAAKRRR